MTKKFIPAVSVIIPMYNAEKYIGECLDSIFAQTFQDFEIIVVDNCSTDKSCEVVESYVKKFENKIKLIRREKNSGSPGTPNNDGLRFATGEYISFLESDDAITKTAFEELYSVAKNFDADVVCCEKFFEVHGDGRISDNTPKKFSSYIRKDFVTEPTFVSENLADRVNELYNVNFLWPIWTKLIKREFILEKNLQMVNVNHHDMIYTSCLICSAKKIIRVPNVVNFYRVLENSLSHKKDNPQKIVSEKVKTLTAGFNYLNEFLDRQENFKDRKDLKYIVFDTIVKEFVQYFLPIYEKIPAHQLDEIIQAEFEKAENKTALPAFIFSRMNIFNLNLIRQQKIILQQQEQIKNLQAQLQK